VPRTPFRERDELSGPSCRRAHAREPWQPRGAPSWKRLLFDGPREDTGHSRIRQQHDGVERTLTTEPVDERRERRALHMAVAEELTAEIDQQRIVARQSVDRPIGSDHVDDRRFEPRGARRALANTPFVRQVHLASRDQHQQRSESPAQRALVQQISFDPTEARRRRGTMQRKHRPRAGLGVDWRILCPRSGDPDPNERHDSGDSHSPPSIDVCNMTCDQPNRHRR
jgi:hypothetical protein